MASSYRTYDANIITLRQIYVRTNNNDFIPSSHILISDGGGAAYWNSVSSIFPISTFNAVRGTNGSTFYADHFNNILNVSTTGIEGLLESYVDPATSTLMLSNAAIPIQVATGLVPTVSRLAAQAMPGGQTMTFSTGQSTLKLLGVGDIQLSTVADLRSVFISISSFTATGYADLSGEGRAWRPYTYSTNSTSAGYATFISSLPFSTSVSGVSWDWSPIITSNLRMSTVDSKPTYSTGDLYFSTLSFSMSPFYRYIHPNSTTKVFLEVKPNYFFDRLYLGTSTPYTLMKPISSFLQYQTVSTGRVIFSRSIVPDMITSQQSNLYTSNYYNTGFKMEIDTPTLMSNLFIDGPVGGYYTLYHRIPGGMATLQPDSECACDYIVGGRGGFISDAPTFDNRTGLSNSVFLHVYNQQGAALPLPGP